MQSDLFIYPTLLCSHGPNKIRAHTRYWGNRDDGVAVRALASHQCGLGSSPSGDAIYGLNCCWFSILLRKVSLRVLQLLLSSRQEASLLKTMSQFQFDSESVSRWVHLEDLSFKRSWNCQVPPSLNNVSLVWFFLFRFIILLAFPFTYRCLARWICKAKPVSVLQVPASV